MPLRVTFYIAVDQIRLEQIGVARKIFLSADAVENRRTHAPADANQRLKRALLRNMFDIVIAGIDV